MPVVGFQVQRLILIAIIHTILKSSLVCSLLCIRLRLCRSRRNQHRSCTQCKYKYDFGCCSQHKSPSLRYPEAQSGGHRLCHCYWILESALLLPESLPRGNFAAWGSSDTSNWE